MRSIYLLIFVFCAVFVRSQTLIYYEDFGTGTNCATDYGRPVGSYSGVFGSWYGNTTVGTNSVSANIWYVSQTEAGRTVGTCGETCIDSSQLFNKTLHIGNVGGSPNSSSLTFLCPNGDCGARYDVGGVAGNPVTTHIRAESPSIPVVGYTNISLQFDYILGGDSANINDYLTVWYFDGAFWHSLGTPPQTPTCAISANSGGVDGVWATLVLPISTSSVTGLNNIKIGFEWVNNNDGKGSNPSVAIDNVTLLANNSVPLPSTLTVTIIPPDSANHNFVYCTGTPYNFTGFANPSATNYQWTCSPAGTVSFRPSPAYQNGEAITFADTGKYTLTLHCNSPFGAKDTTLTVHVVPTPTISVSPKNISICNGGLGTNLYAHGAHTYTWTESLTTTPPNYLDPNGDSVFVNPSTLHPPQVFTYSVIGTSTDGCVSKPVVATVTAIPIPTPYFSVQPDTICFGGHTTLYVDSMPATTTYTWSNIGGQNGGIGGPSGSSQPATPIYFGTQDTVFNYEVQLNVPSCPPDFNPHTFTIHVLSLPKVTVTADTLDNCNGMGDTLRAATTPASNTLTWYKKGSNVPLAPMNGFPNDAIVKPTGPTTYYVQAQNIYGCKSTKDSVRVLIGDTTNASVTSLLGTVCQGQSTVLTAYPQNMQSVNTSYQYSWGVTVGDSVYIISSSPTKDTMLVAPHLPTPTSSGVTYTVMVNGICVKKKVASVQIMVNNCDTPAVYFSANTHTLCAAPNHCIAYTDSTQFLSQRPLYYTMTFVGETSVTQFPNNSTSLLPAPFVNTYTFSLLNNTDTLKPFKVCYAVPSTNNNASGTGYFPVIEVVKNGIGEVDSLIDSVLINKGPLPRVSVSNHVTSSTTIDQGNSVTLCSTQSSTFTPTNLVWVQPDSLSYLSCPSCECTIVTPSVTTQYTLTMMDNQGCADSAVINVIVDIICKDVFIATAFSPNGDGMNDVLHVKSNCPISNFSFKIFDRWGEKVFESTDEDTGWDGYYHNKLMDTGVFMYTVDGFLSSGKEVKKKGNVTLMR